MTPVDLATVITGLAAMAAVPDPALAAVPMGLLQDILRFLLGIERIINQVLAIIATILRIIGKIMWIFGG